MREKLLAEVGNITSADLAAAWAREALTAKNSLTATDAKLVEDAFERSLSELPSSDAAAPSTSESSAPQISEPQVSATSDGIDAGPAKGIDKSILAVAAPRRYRNREHLSNLDPSLFDRVGRYEARLWRQAAQTIWTLDALRRPPPTTARRSLRKPVMPFFLDSEHSRMS